MGKKDQKPAGGGKKADGGNEDAKRDQKLQAILLADSFSKTFRPVTWEKPKVLLPLVNVPMLEYTIEFLAQNGVEELFVFCVWHAEMLQEYLNASKWPSAISVRCITSTACLSAGDALRELDGMGVIRSDPFILISGDVISNMDLKKAIAFHKEKRKDDNNCIMTVVLKQVQDTAAAKPVLDDLVVGIDRTSSQLLLFDDSCKKSSLKVPLEIMAEHPGLNFRSNLLDCHVDICSPELMLQFSDNFDYQDIRRDFIQNEVVNWELGMHIYGYIIQNEYAARVHDPRTYHSICRDIVTRWVYPLVPDAQLLPDSTYTHSKRYVYREQGVRIARSAKIGEGVVLGRGSIIEEGVVLERTIVGRDCFVGAGAVVVESHLWAGAKVEDGAQINEAIICDKAVVKRNAKIGRGCVVSYGAVVGENVVLADYTRISRLKSLAHRAGGSGKDLVPDTPVSSTKNDYDEGALGVDGVGHVWTYEGSGDYDEACESDSDDDEGSQNTPHVDALRAYSMGCREEEAWKRNLWKVVPIPVEEDDDDDDDDDYDNLDDEDRPHMDDTGDFEPFVGKRSTASAASSCRATTGGDSASDLFVGGMGSSNTSSKSNAAPTFFQVVGDMVTTGYEESHPADNLLMEIKGYKFAQNKSFADCLRGIVPPLLAIAVQEGEKNAPAATATASGKVSSAQVQIVAFLKQFLSASTPAQVKGAKSKSWGHTLLTTLTQDAKDELVIIETIEAVVLQEQYAGTLYPIFRIILQLLYDEDIATEDAFLAWITARENELPDEDDADAVSSSLSPRLKLFKQPLVQQFVEWIQQDEESDDEEDGDDDDDE